MTLIRSAFGCFWAVAFSLWNLRSLFDVSSFTSAGLEWDGPTDFICYDPTYFLSFLFSSLLFFSCGLLYKIFILTGYNCKIYLIFCHSNNFKSYIIIFNQFYSWSNILISIYKLLYQLYSVFWHQVNNKWLYCK